LRIIRIVAFLSASVEWSVFMVRITAAELQKQFGRYCEAAIREPVSVTHHGRESLVMLSADKYKRSKARDGRKALYTWELRGVLAEALAKAEPPESSRQSNHEV
jgi:prevent-host-death family protein